MEYNDLLSFAFRFGPVVPLHSPITHRDGSLGCSCRRSHADRPKTVGKHPRVNRDFHGAAVAAWTQLLTGDDSTIRGWYNRWRGTNWGVLPGYRIVIIDADIKNGVNGEETLEALEYEHGHRIPGSLRVRTGSGGLHIYLGLPNGVTVTAQPGKWANVDVLGLGSLAVMPGSVHHSGNYYEWIEAYCDAWSTLEEAPDWLLGLVGHVAQTTDDTASKSLQTIPVSLSYNTGVGECGESEERGQAEINQGLMIREPRLTGNQKAFLFKLAQKYEKFAATWGHDRGPRSKYPFRSGNYSPSTYEMSIAQYLVAAGWDDQSIVDACVTWRHTHKHPVPEYASKYVNTLQRARSSNDGKFKVSLAKCETKNAYKHGDRRFAIFTFLAAAGPKTPAEIAEALGVNRSTVRNTLIRMLEPCRATYWTTLIERQSGMYGIASEIRERLNQEQEPVCPEPTDEELAAYFAAVTD